MVTQRTFVARPPGGQDPDTVRQMRELELVLRAILDELEQVRARLDALEAAP